MGSVALEAVVAMPKQGDQSFPNAIDNVLTRSEQLEVAQSLAIST